MEDGAGGVRGVAREDLEDPPEVDVHGLGAQHVPQQHEGSVVGLDQGEELVGGGVAGVYRAPANGASGTTVTLSKVSTVSLGAAQGVTGGDVTPAGDVVGTILR